MRKIQTILCVFILTMLVISCHAFAQEKGAWIISSETDTQGSWQNVYGNDGYLFFFATTDLTSGRDTPLAEHLQSLPSYATVTLKSRYNYSVAANPSSDVRAPQMPASTVRKAVNPYAYGSVEMEIEIKDNASHFISFYMPIYSDLKSNRVFSLMNTNGEQIDCMEIDASKGPYVTVEANETFRIKLINEQYPAETVSISGILFDSEKTSKLSGFSAEYLGRRTIGLSWSGNGEAAVFRTKDNEKTEKIAVISAGNTAYTDNNLQPGALYSYQLRGTDGMLYSQPLFAQEEVEVYEKSSLTVTNGKQRFPTAYGETVKISLSAERGENPAAFEEIFVTIDGKYVGEFIDSELGTIITDENGNAVFNYYPKYYGEYDLCFTILTDDDRKFDSAYDAVTIALPEQKWNSVPFLSDISNEISHGEVFNIYGYGITGQVAVAAKKADGIAPGSVPEDAILLPVIQTDEDSGRGFYVTAMLLDSADDGVYDIWVKNDFGWSSPIRLNEAQGQFLTENEINERTDVRIIGRNLDAEKFGDDSSVSVRLSDSDGNRYPVIIKDSNRVAVTFTVPDNIPVGEYYVDVNNSSANNWSRVKTNQTLTVKRYVEDPFQLDVAWSDVFTYTDYYAKDFGIIANSELDQTALFQTAINTIESNGGGVLHLPVGTFNLTTLYMGSGVILCGASTNDTILRYVGKTGTFLLFSDLAGKYGKVGFANFSMVSASDEYLPNPWIMLSSKNMESDAQCDHVFVIGVNMNYTFVNSKNYEGIRLATKGEKLIVKDCNLHGQAATITSGRVKAYCRIINNTFEYCAAAPHCLAEYSVIEGNNFICNREAYLQLRQLYSTQNHGMKVGSHSYYYNNYTCFTGAAPDDALASNDGEIAFAEAPSGTLATGNVLTADRNSLEIEVNTSTIQEEGLLAIPETPFGFCSIAIIGGRGAGQYRSIASVSGKNKITVTEPWSVIPDGSSIYSVIYIFEDITFYRNRAYDCKSAMLFYQNCVDAACLENELDTTGGIQTTGFYIPSSSRGNPAWNIWIEDNTSLNQRVLDSESIGTSGITAFTTKHYPANLLMGYEVKNNTVTAYENSALGMGCFTMGGSSDYPCFGTGTLFTGNSISGFQSGMKFSGGISGVILENNIFENCETDIELGNAQNVQDISECLPDIPQQSISQNRYGQLSVLDPAIKNEYYPYPIELDNVAFYMETEGGMNAADNLDRLQCGDVINASANILNNGNDDITLYSYITRYSSNDTLEQIAMTKATIYPQESQTVNVQMEIEQEFAPGEKIILFVFDGNQRPVLSSPICKMLMRE